MHLHKFPEIASFIVSLLTTLPEFIKLTPDIINPGVQYPHWEAYSFEKAICNGWGFLSQPKPSMVVMLLPITWPNLTKHEFMGFEFSLFFLFIITEHAPQSPSAQPSFVPVILW